MRPDASLAEQSHPQKQFSVGIDLGTTHCAIASVKLGSEETPAVHQIPQVVNPGQRASSELLPSFIYLAAGSEFSEGALDVPWATDRRFVVGQFARAHGAKVPHRLVASAKSWLCHDGVDRQAAILPHGAGPEVEKLSPLDASTKYLRHLVETWAVERADALPLREQQVVLTVPASFDAVARDLTVQAARAAGLERPVLLEEPQAALYAWLDAQGEGWRNQLEPGDVVLVCDVGGGTTDFSLIAIEEEQGTLVLRRVAVGDHILLGGDNMDLALAFTVRQQLERDRGIKLDRWQLQGLTQGCRTAKEALLNDESMERYPLVIPSRGSKLIGGTIRAELTREQLTTLLVDGFFPRCSVADQPRQARRTGLSEVGLPYAADAGITRHLAHFLTRQAAGGDPGDFVKPTAVLFNGGVLKADILRDRVTAVINDWLTQAARPGIKVLDTRSLDVSVAQGAAYFGRVKADGGIRIRGGIARSYYVGIEQAMPAIPGFEPPMMALCLAPFGLEEGSYTELPDEEFGLYVGEQAHFKFYASSVRQNDEPGVVLEDWNDGELEALPEIITSLSAGEGRAVGQRVAVSLRAEVTEVGTLLLSCVEREGTGRWNLEFNVRLKQDEQTVDDEDSAQT
ncbi:MAG: Hsp70 family protein [Bradymonadia bacterium]